MDSPSAWQGWWPRAAEQHGPPARPRLAQDRRSAAPQCPRRHSHDLPKPVTECGGEGADDVGTTPGTSHRHRGGTSRREHSTIWPVRSATATWSASTTASAGAPSTRTARWPGGCAPGAWSSWPPCPPPCGGSRPEGSTWSPPPSWWRRPRRPDLDEDPSPPGRCRASGRSFCPNGARSQHSTTSVLRPSRLSHPGRVGSDTRPSPLGAVPAGRAASKGRNVDPIAPPVPTDERTSRWRALRSPALATLVVFLALAVWHFRLTWTAPRGATIGGHGDPWLFVWFLKSDQLAVTHAHSPLFSHELNVTGGVNLTWNTSVILPGVLLAGVTAWLGPVFTYNLLVTLALPLSAWAASLVFRRYVRSQLAAAVGGLLYGFSPYMVAHALGHLHLILAVTPPLLLALLDEVLVRQRAAPWLLGLALGVVAAAQLLTAEELLASELLAATGALGLLVVLYPRQLRTHAPYAGKALAVGRWWGCCWSPGRCGAAGGATASAHPDPAPGRGGDRPGEPGRPDRAATVRASRRRGGLRPLHRQRDRMERLPRRAAAAAARRDRGRLVAPAAGPGRQPARRGPGGRLAGAATAPRRPPHPHPPAVAGGPGHPGPRQPAAQPADALRLPARGAAGRGVHRRGPVPPQPGPQAAGDGRGRARAACAAAPLTGPVDTAERAAAVHLVGGGSHPAWQRRPGRPVRPLPPNCRTDALAGHVRHAFPDARGVLRRRRRRRPRPVRPVRDTAVAGDRGDRGRPAPTTANPHPPRHPPGDPPRLARADRARRSHGSPGHHGGLLHHPPQPTAHPRRRRPRLVERGPHPHARAQFAAAAGAAIRRTARHRHRQAARRLNPAPLTRRASSARTGTWQRATIGQVMCLVGPAGQTIPPHRRRTWVQLEPVATPPCAEPLR